MNTKFECWVNNKRIGMIEALDKQDAIARIASKLGVAKHLVYVRELDWSEGDSR